MIEKLRLFLVILEEGTLRRAAERLHISQSAITRQIQLLEHDLGGRLLERTPAGVRPSFISHLSVPNVAMVPIADKQATWDLFLVWQRGKTSGPLRALLDSLQPNPNH